MIEIFCEIYPKLALTSFDCLYQRMVASLLYSHRLAEMMEDIGSVEAAICYRQVAGDGCSQFAGDG